MAIVTLIHELVEAGLTLEQAVMAAGKFEAHALAERGSRILRALTAAGVTGGALMVVLEHIVADLAVALPQAQVAASPVKRAAALRTARYRSRRGLPESAWMRLRARVLRRDRHICAYCGAADAHHCDHVVPLAQGGTNDESNLVAACSRCNQSKGGRSLQEWRSPYGSQS